MNEIEARLTQGLQHPSWDVDVCTERVLDDVLRRRTHSRSGPGRAWIGISAGTVAAACGAVLTLVLQHPGQPADHVPAGGLSTSTSVTTPAPVTSSFIRGGSLSPSPVCRPPSTAAEVASPTDPALPICPTTVGLPNPSPFGSPR